MNANELFISRPLGYSTNAHYDKNVLNLVKSDRFPDTTWLSIGTIDGDACLGVTRNEMKRLVDMLMCHINEEK